MQIPLQQTVAPRLSSLLLLRLNQPDTHVRVVRGGPDPCGFRRLFQEKVGGPRISEFFSRSAVSLVTAKGEPREVE
jgi:hypothetical protein